jgi:Kef-type K+ transport system membrane component KefB
MLDHELSRLLLSLVVLLFFAFAVGHIFTVIRLPRVIGEICAGLLLGPSLLGYIEPDLQAWIFNGFPEQKKLLSVFYWLGLILLMFTAGFKISGPLSKEDRPLLAALIVGGMGLPFLFGFGASPLFPNAASPNPLAFSLVIAVASAVTSIPVITRIFMDLEMASSRFSQVVLTAAAIQDIILWIIVSLALAVQQEQVGTPTGIAPVVVGTALFAAFSILVVPGMLRFGGRFIVPRSPEGSLLGYTLLVCLVLVSLASVLKVNIVFGALLAGLIIGRLPASRLDQVKQNITNLAVWFFVPIYFALVGLQMNLPANFNAKLIFGFFLMSSAVKILSVAVMVRFTRLSAIKALDYGVTMNARGGPGIVLASVTFASGIIDESLFVALVLTSMLTSLMTGIWLRWRSSFLLA